MRAANRQGAVKGPYLLSAAIALSEDAASAPAANDFRTILRVVIFVTPASLMTGQIIVHDALLRASSVDVLRGSQALEHRRPHQEGTGALAVGRNRAPPRRVLFLQNALVLNCHRLEKFIGDKAPLPII